MSETFSATYDTTDVDRLTSNLVRRAPAVGADAARDAAESVANRARGRLPRRSGRLIGSMRVEADPENEARLVVGAPYAGWIEYGGNRGRPYVPDGRYVGPSVEGSEQTMADSAERGLERAMR